MSKKDDYTFSMSGEEIDETLQSVASKQLALEVDESIEIIKAKIGDKVYAIRGISVVEKPETPSISADGSDTAASRNITISCMTVGAQIYYTTDGTDPTVQSKTYSQFKVNASLTEKTTKTVIKAIAAKNGEISDVASVSVETARHLAVPSISADGDDYSTSRMVSITHSDSGVTIKYKIGDNGTWQTYSEEFEIKVTSKVYAKVEKTDWQDSAETSSTFTVGNKIAYYGFSTKATLTASDIVSLASTGGSVKTAKLSGALVINPTGTTAGYVWLCCTGTLNKDAIVPKKGDVIPFGFESAISVGGYNCYRCTNAINPEQTNVYIP